MHLRNPAAVRPWQHVLEPLNAYLLLAERLCTTPEGMDEAWNIGPEASENRPVRAVAQAVVAAFGRGRIEITPDESAPHEAHFLTLDCTKAHERLGWHPRLSFEKTIAMTADWYSAWARSVDVAALTTAQITTFMETGA